MKKILTKLVALLAVLTMLMSMTAVSIAEETASEPVTAWLLYFANPGWWPQHQRVDQPSSETGVDATNAVITGPGNYTVGLKFNWQTAENAMQFNLVLDNAEKLMPGLYVDITDIRVNGTSIAMTADNMYGVFHDDTESGFAPIYNTYWDVNHADGAGSTGPAPETMRAFDGVMDTEHYQIIDPAQIKAGSTIEVDFVVAKEAGKLPEDIGDAPYVSTTLEAAPPVEEPTVLTNAWIFFQAGGGYWPDNQLMEGNPGTSISSPADITGEGHYTASMRFYGNQWWSPTATGSEKFWLVIENVDTALPEYYVNVTDVRIDGVSIDVKPTTTYQMTDPSWYYNYAVQEQDSITALYDNEAANGNTPYGKTWQTGAENTYAAIDPSQIQNASKIEVDFFISYAQDVVPEKPEEDTGIQYTWFGDTIGLAGLSLSDLGIANDWHNIVPVDLTKTAYYTYTLVGADAHIIGNAIVAVNNGNVSVQCVYARGEIYEKAQCIKWFTNLEDITAAELASREGGLTCNDIVNVDTDLGGAEIAYLSINNHATWSSPINPKGETLPRYWRNGLDWRAYRNTLLEMMPGFEPVAIPSAPASSAPVPSPSVTTDDVE